MWNSITSSDVMTYIERNQGIYRNILDNVYEENRHHRHINHSTRVMYRTIINSMTQTERQLVNEYIRHPRRQTSTFSAQVNQPSDVNLNIPRIDVSGNVTFSDWPNYENVEIDGSGSPQPIIICPITHQTFIQGDRIARVNRCGHVFSEIAFRTWIRNHNTCPVCRGTIDPTFQSFEVRGLRIPQPVYEFT